MSSLTLGVRAARQGPATDADEAPGPHGQTSASACLNDRVREAGKGLHAAFDGGRGFARLHLAHLTFEAGQKDAELAHLKEGGVEMESLQFVGCSWFIGLIGLGFRFTQNKITSTELCALPRPSPVSSSTHLDAPGVPSAAGSVAIPLALSDPDSREFSDSLLFEPTDTVL